MRLSLRAAAALAAVGFSLPVASGAAINEIRQAQPGPDDNEFVELFGTPGESLAGLALVVLSGEFNPGLVNNFVDLDAQSLDINGLLTLGAAALGPDITLDDPLFAGNYLLVSGVTSTPMAGDDLDADDDGVLDAGAFFTSVIDGVFLTDGGTDGDPDFNYGAPIEVGPDGTFEPAYVFRDVDGTGTFQIGAFGDVSLDTPGALNNPTAIPEPTGLAGLALLGGIAAVRRRRR